MLRSDISNITNIPVTLVEFKSYAGGITHNLKDDTINLFIQTAIIWASEITDIAAADFNVVLTETEPCTEIELLYTNIDTIISVKNLTTGDNITYTSSEDKRIITLDSVVPVIVEYTCSGSSNPLLKSSLLEYTLLKYSGQTDADAIRRIENDLCILKENLI